MKAEADPTGALVRRLVREVDRTGDTSTLESLAQLPITAAENVCELDATVAVLGVDRVHLVYWFKRLSEVGCGRFIVGRKGHRSRFEWWFDPGSVFSAALKQRSDLDPLAAGQESAGIPWDVRDQELTEENNSESGDPPALAGDSTIEHTFMLRAGFPVRIVLPESFTKAEAERLAGFIRTLPFA